MNQSRYVTYTYHPAFHSTPKRADDNRIHLSPALNIFQGLNSHQEY